MIYMVLVTEICLGWQNGFGKQTLIWGIADFLWFLYHIATYWPHDKVNSPPPFLGAYQPKISKGSLHSHVNFV